MSGLQDRLLDCEHHHHHEPGIQKVRSVPEAHDHTHENEKRHSHSAKDNWKIARVNVKAAVRVKHAAISLKDFAKQTNFMKEKSAREQEFFVFIFMASIILLGAATAMTKSAMFKLQSVGRWDDGHPYTFGYALTLTMVIFLLKVGLGFIHICWSSHDEEDDDGKGGGASRSSLDLDGEEKTWLDFFMPWVVLVAFTFFEMLSATVASLGLLYGAPTSLFVILKNSKAVFMAILSVIFLKRKLLPPQWASLVLMTAALVLSSFAEGGSKKKGGFSVVGPLLLLLSELFHAAMMVLQEIAVKHYWDNPLKMISASAVVGVILTGSTMLKMRQVWIDLPDGGHRPASDPVDSWIMCLHNPVLMVVWVTHLVVHVSQDVAHIVILKHVTGLARTLGDSFKMVLMWGLGKLFWFLGILPFLAEAWHPGLVGSWLMIPSIGMIVYSTLMFKNKTYFPFKTTSGGLAIEKNKFEKGDGDTSSIKMQLDDPFYTSMFTSQKLTKNMHKREKLKAKSMFLKRQGSSV